MRMLLLFGSIIGFTIVLGRNAKKYPEPLNTVADNPSAASMVDLRRAIVQARERNLTFTTATLERIVAGRQPITARF